MELTKRSHWTWRQFIICFFISMGMLGFAYPSAVIATTLGQPTFLIYMELLSAEGALTPQANSLIGAMSGVFQAGGVIGIIALAHVNDRWGRRVAMWTCAGLGLVGGTFLCAAQNVGMFIAFRFFAGAGAWSFLSISPVYCSEIAPPGLRGLFVGMCGVFVGLGYALGTYMGLAFYTATNDAQWRGQYGVTIFINLVMIVAVYFTPESPRWLLMMDRPHAAKEVVQNLYNLTETDEHNAAIAELYQMQRQTEYDRSLDPSWLQMFRRPSYRKRVILTCGYAFVGQSTACMVINNYGSILYAGLGAGLHQQLVYQCGWATVGVLGNAVGALIMDRIGRKPLMALGIGGCMVCLIIEMVTVAKYASPVPEVPNQAGLAAAVAMLYIFVFLYGLGVDVAGYVFFAEVYPNHLRAKGLALSGASIALANLIYLQAAPTAFATIGWKFYLLFICICAIGVVWVILCLPETKGIPLEEVAALFGDQDEIMVLSIDLQVDPNTDEVAVTEHGEGPSLGTDPGHM